MPKRKTDEQLRAEILMHSKTARDLFGKSHEIHQESFNEKTPSECILTMRRVIEFQRLAIKETKSVTRLEKILFDRQLKSMNNPA